MTVVRPDTDLTDGGPVVPSRGALRPLGPAQVRLTGGFWARRQQVNGQATLEHARGWMDQLGWVGNFAVAREGRGSRVRRGRQFSDSEVYKLVEAMAWEYGRTGDEDLDARITELTKLIGSAQAEDGYLSTAFGGPGQPARYSDFSEGHELYCMGHLIQAAVARARTGGTDDLLDVAIRIADHICETFGSTGRTDICGHPQIEGALVELSRATGEPRYLRQAELFVRRRGHRTLRPGEFGWQYFSDDDAVRDASVLRGHSVRALYLAAGAVDVAVELDDADLLAAVVRQFDQTLARRTYVTGGMGSHHADEAFGADFELPPDRAYSETCAGVATVMLAWRLLLATGRPEYGDVIERVLYNVVATSVADDGRSFFYANTLHQRTPVEPPAADREALAFGGGARAPWYEVSCCLQNAARLLASLASYISTVDDDGIRLHQYADADLRIRLADGRAVGLELRTGYPDDGAVVVRVTETDGGAFSLGLRIPAWADGAILHDGTTQRVVAPGNAVVRRQFTAGDEVRLELPVRTRWYHPDPRIDAVRDCVVAQRGPVVLCAESIDQAGLDLDTLQVDLTPPRRDGPDTVIVAGYERPVPDEAWPYGPAAPTDQPGRPVEIRLIPYHRWGRRSSSTMRVWLPRTHHRTSPLDSHTVPADHGPTMKEKA